MKDKLSEQSTPALKPGIGTPGAMMVRGLKDTSSRLPKDLGRTLRRTRKTTLRSYDSPARGGLLCPHRQGRVANMANHQPKIQAAVSNDVLWQLPLQFVDTAAFL
ncbi:hypothetical protein [Dorea formicigenerans]|uniref:hypothetical protein n=1 Tax=Dorea formicigenerans TaxID=39486 RepID=UPI0016425285|nr:hypothetical protein [Dorea formicigenerans]